MTKLARYPPPQTEFCHDENRSLGNSFSETGKMDPDTLPRPTGLGEPGSVENLVQFASDKYGFPPSSTSEFVCIDSGSATLRYARPTTNHVPAWPSLQLNAALPLGCHFQPFAEVHEREEGVVVVEPSAYSGAFRCEKCMGYVNPHFSWLDEGRKAKCNLCQHVSQVPHDYMSPINGGGLRMDRFMRPELRSGSVDFLPARETVNAGSVPVTVFLIDTSHMSYKLGFLHSITVTLRANLEKLPLECEVGFVFFNDEINFVRFEFSRNASPSLVTVSEVDDPFVPDNASCFFASPHLLTDQIYRILDLAVQCGRNSNPNRIGCCSFSALLAACELLFEKGGGSVMVFQASPCKFGLLTTEENINSVSDKCIQGRVCVDFFVSSDLGSTQGMSLLVARVGGGFFLSSSSDLETVLSHHLVREKYHDCLIRVRASKGLVVDQIFDIARVRMRGSDALLIPRLLSDSTISVNFSVRENLGLNQSVFIQFACLYSRADGTRLLRVHTVMLNTTGQLGQVFKFADTEAVALLMAKESIAISIDRRNFSIREHLITTLVSILHAYRTQCALNAPSGQLILPDSLKLLPLQICGLLKQPGLRSDNTSTKTKTNTILFDEKLIFFWSIFYMSIPKAAYDFTPRCFCIHPSDNPSSLIPASSSKLSASKILLFDIHDEILFYIGKDVDVAVVQDLLGTEVAHRQQEAKKFQPLVNIEHRSLNDRLKKLVHALRRNRTITLKCALATSSAGEAKISNLLIEDRMGGEPGYIDWLCLLHRLIQEKIDY